MIRRTDPVIFFSSAPKRAAPLRALGPDQHF